MKQEILHTKTEKLLLEAARVFNSTLDYEELIKLVLKLVIKAVGSEGAMAFRYDQEHTDMRVRFLKSGSEEVFTCTHELGQGVLGWVAENQEAVIINNPSEDDRIDYDLRNKCGIKVKSLLSVPLIGKGQFIGVIDAVNKIDGEFSNEDMDILIGLSNQIAVAIDNAHLYRQVKREILEKSILYEIGKTLSGSLKLDEVLQVILNSLKSVIDFDAAGVLIIDDGKTKMDAISVVGYTKEQENELHLQIGQGLVGHIAESGKTEIVSDVSKDPRYFKNRLNTNSELIAPIMVDDKVIGILNLESNTLNAYSQSDISLIDTFASQAGISIERAITHQQKLDNKKIKEQLEIARNIQKSFLPEKNPDVAGFDISGMNISSEEVGGDYYDFIDIGNGSCGIAIGDVSGKGIPAALIMAALRASLLANVRNDFPLTTIVEKVNDLMVESTEPGTFVTFVFGLLDCKESTFDYVNCGHNLPILIRANGDVDYLEEGGQILGVTMGADYKSESLKFNSGDVLFLYTDGVTEVFDDKDEEYGLKRLVELLKKNQTKSSQEIEKTVLQEIRKFAAPDQKFDDITTLVIKKL